MFDFFKKKKVDTDEVQYDTNQEESQDTPQPFVDDVQDDTPGFFDTMNDTISDFVDTSGEEDLEQSQDGGDKESETLVEPQGEGEDTRSVEDQEDDAVVWSSEEGLSPEANSDSELAPDEGYFPEETVEDFAADDDYDDWELSDEEIEEDFDDEVIDEDEHLGEGESVEMSEDANSEHHDEFPVPVPYAPNTDSELEDDENLSQLFSEEAEDSAIDPNGRQEALAGIASHIKSVVDSNRDNPIVVIRDTVEEIKSAIDQIVNDATVFLIDFTNDKHGYKVVPDSAVREFAPLETEESSYLDGLDIINLIKENQDSYDSVFIIVSGADVISEKIFKALEGNRVALDMIVSKIREAVTDADESGIRIIAAATKNNEFLEEIVSSTPSREAVQGVEIGFEESDSSEASSEGMEPNAESNSIDIDPHTNDEEAPDFEDESEGEEEVSVNRDESSTIKDGVEYGSWDNVVAEEPEEEISTTEDSNEKPVGSVNDYLQSVGKPTVEDGLSNPEEKPGAVEETSSTEEKATGNDKGNREFGFKSPFKF